MVLALEKAPLAPPPGLAFATAAAPLVFAGTEDGESGPPLEDSARLETVEEPGFQLEDLDPMPLPEEDMVMVVWPFVGGKRVDDPLSCVDDPRS